MSVDGDWLVWSENTPNQSPGDWAIQAYNLRTGAFRQLATAPRVNGAPVQGPAPLPVVSDGHVIWSEDTRPVIADESQTYKYSVVRLEDLDTGSITTLATSAAAAALSWPWVAWGVFPASNDSNGHILFTYLLTRQSAILDEAPDYLVLHETTAVYSFLPRPLFQIPDISIPDISQSVTALPVFTPTAAGGTEVQEPSISDRLIAWDSVSGPPVPMVWDRVSPVLVSLPTTSAQNYVAWTGGHLLVWNDPESAAQQAADQQKNLDPLYTICVVDTRTLPNTPPA